MSGQQLDIFAAAPPLPTGRQVLSLCRRGQEGRGPSVRERLSPYLPAHQVEAIEVVAGTERVQREDFARVGAEIRAVLHGGRA